jgi:hypothetical protein
VWQSSWVYVGGLDAAELEVVEYHMSGYLFSTCAVNRGQRQHGCIYVKQITDMIYLGWGEHANNKNRLDAHLYGLLCKTKTGEPLTRKLF